MANKWVKFMAIFALAWILISIIWTWIIFVIWNNNQEQIELNEGDSLDVNKFLESIQENEISTWETETWKILEIGDVKITDTNSWDTLSWNIEIETEK